MDEKEKEKERLKKEIAILEDKMSKMSENYRSSMILRGMMIEKTIVIERLIDTFLSNYFAKNKFIGNELHEVLWCTERITLGSKKDILFVLLRKHYKDFLENTPDFISRLESVIPHRNNFAHLEIDLSEDAINRDAILLKKYKNGKLELREYSTATLTPLIDDMDAATELLRDLIKTSKTLSG
jgi:hypothetical protein